MKIQRKIGILFFMALLLVASGCGQKDEQPKFTTGKNTYSSTGVQTESTEKENDEEKTKTTGLYVVMQIDTQSEVITLQKVENGKLVERYYNGGTCFYNKYGDIMSIARLELGCVVNFQASDDMVLTEVRVSDTAWERKEVSKYSFDSDKNIFCMDGLNYAFDGDTCFFSDDGAILLSDIGMDDKLRVWGIDKKILSVTVTTGHGEVEFLNTEAFRGGYVLLCGANKYYYEITDSMELEIPEGTYELTAAGNGYGGSMEVTVERNQCVSVDLDTLKGEGPKSCILSFTVTVPDTTVLLDGQTVDISTPITVPYGTHALQAAATGYSAWSRQLVVNSQTANIIIDVTSGDKTSEEESETATGTAETADTPETTGVDGSTTQTGTSHSTTQTGTTHNTTHTNGTTQTGTSNSTTSTGTENGTSSGSSQNSMSSNITDDPQYGESDTASDAYLDTLSGIMDTLTGK